jgi:hypothetical protein
MAVLYIVATLSVICVYGTYLEVAVPQPLAACSLFEANTAPTDYAISFVENYTV